MTDEPILKIQGLVKDFGDFRALKGIDLEFGKGLLVGLIGPNGCGKSTMMKCISRLHPQTSGTIEVAGIPISMSITVLFDATIVALPLEPDAMI